jgi:hypothetical protein
LSWHVKEELRIVSNGYRRGSIMRRKGVEGSNSLAQLN